MNARIKKNSIKKLLSFVGIASASVFLTFPAFASNVSNVNNLNQSYGEGIRSADSTKNIGELSARNRDRSQKKKCCRQRGTYRGNPTTGEGYRGVIWTCLNNPNQKCRS